MKHFLISACAVLLGTATTQAAIIYSGLQNIPLPFNPTGVYVNILTGATSTSEPLSISTAPWVYASFGGSGLSTSPLIRPVVNGAVIAGGEQISNLAYGDVVNGMKRFSIGDLGFNGSETHVGPAINQFQLGLQGYIGYEFEPTTGGPSYFAVMRLTIANDGASATIHDWSYENTPGMAIAVPEPGRGSLLLLGTLLLTARRRRPQISASPLALGR